MNYVSINGALLNKEDQSASLDSIERMYGFGVYENIRVKAHIPYFVTLHIERLLHSAKIIGLEHTYTHSDIEKHIQALLETIIDPAINLKLLLIGGARPEQATLTILPLRPRFPDRTLYKQGATAITVAYERYLPQAKSLNMLGSYIAYKQAQANSAYDALLVDRHGNIPEGTRTNFFVTKGTQLITPPSAEILEGVTRKLVMHVASHTGWEIVEAAIPLDSIASYDAAFLTSTSSKIMPLRSIDAATIKIPQELKQLMRDFNDLLKHSNGVFKE